MSYSYVNKENKAVGPHTQQELMELLQRGEISHETTILADNGQSLSLASVPSMELSVPKQMPPPVPVSQPMQVCPFCAETILAQAKKCKHCGETLDVSLRAAQEAQRMAVAGSGGGGGGGAASSSSTVVVMGGATKNFPHVMHLIVTLITFGIWFPIWILHYLFRDRRTYG